MVERRKSERLALSVEALLRRRSTQGGSRQVTARMANVSGGGAFLHAPETVEPGERLLVLFRLSRSGKSGPRVAARARVLRAEDSGQGSCGIAVQFTNHRFL